MGEHLTVKSMPNRTSTSTSPHRRPSLGNCRHMVNLTQEQTDKLDAACARLQMTRAAVLRKLFRDGIDKLE